MGYKIKHYAQPVKTNVKSIIEVILIEFSVGLICAGMAYWARDVEIRLAIGCLTVAIICLFLTIHNIVVSFRIIKAKKLKAGDDVSDKK